MIFFPYWLVILGLLTYCIMVLEQFISNNLHLAEQHLLVWDFFDVLCTPIFGAMFFFVAYGFVDAAWSIWVEDLHPDYSML